MLLKCCLDKKNKNFFHKNRHSLGVICKLRDISVDNKKNCWGYKYSLTSKKLKDINLNSLIKVNVTTKEKPTEILKNDFPKIKYFRGLKNPKSSLHWGQLKLLISEVQFFLNVMKENKKYTIIYVGAAIGIHIYILNKMFPNNKWILYDKNKFYDKLHELPNIEINNYYFTDDEAKKLKHRVAKSSVLFISDIRNSTDDEIIEKDMYMQSNWVKILKPEFSLLKFKLPYNRETFDYLKGTIFFQVFAPKKSTETRLLVKKYPKIINYDNRKYEAQCLYHNVYKRLQIYKDGYDDSKEKLYMDSCYDCSLTRIILNRYLKSVYNINFKNNNVFKLIKKIKKYLLNDKLKKDYDEFIASIDI